MCAGVRGRACVHETACAKGLYGREHLSSTFWGLAQAILVLAQCFEENGPVWRGSTCSALSLSLNLLEHRAKGC